MDNKYSYLLQDEQREKIINKIIDTNLGIEKYNISIDMNIKIIFTYLTSSVGVDAVNEIKQTKNGIDVFRTIRKPKKERFETLIYILKLLGFTYDEILDYDFLHTIFIILYDYIYPNNKYYDTDDKFRNYRLLPKNYFENMIKHL